MKTALTSDSSQQVLAHFRCCWSCLGWSWLAYNVYSGDRRLLTHLPVRYVCPRCEATGNSREPASSHTGN